MYTTVLKGLFLKVKAKNSISVAFLNEYKKSVRMNTIIK